MNSNLIHNILNVAIALTSGATAAMLATGCTALPSGVLECAQSWIAPEAAAMIVTGLAVAKTVINVVRDGFSGLIKKQPPVG
jgi:hypothetical protein